MPAPDAGLPLTAPAGLPPATGDPLADAAALCNALTLARLPWRLGAAGPAALDCWSCMALLQRHLFGRKVVLVTLSEEAARLDIADAFASFTPALAQWRARAPGEAPVHGDGVLMSHKQAPHHCGVWLGLDRGVVAHMAEHGGFSADSVQALRLAGYTDLRFFEWIERSHENQI
ncbi:hypothetical protein [Hoeflea sp.]|uniref:hypothetical protein n=1 Tax=Hoeflea sp. TaxID=1940281 RepID=UPI00198A8C7E|nr:hypothetical protein [Hoeflea sp.]MBC7282681.1 hypothetical protein [Hoeflea sp.]